MIELIRQRLTSYHAKDVLEEEQAIKEILQEVALYCLWRGGFFEVAAFQGGTSLRILHKLPRFSKDLDFILQQPNAAFEWGRYLDPLIVGLTEFGLQSEVLDKSKMDRNIREALIKNDSVGNQLNLSFNRGRGRPTGRPQSNRGLEGRESGHQHSMGRRQAQREDCHHRLENCRSGC